MSQRQEQKAQSINDRCDSILALLDSMTADESDMGIPGLLTVVDNLFDMHAKQDAGLNGRVLLSTIHKAKGLEADHTGLLDWRLCPSKYAKRPDQMQQETNLQFVAVTRSKDTITFIDSERITD
jgi:superfamily I DNA/RNA helicase